MKKRIFGFVVLLCAVSTVMAQSGACGADASDMPGDEEHETMYQVATLQSLMTGGYDGFVSVGELRRHGDIGVGTFEGIDGEMIVLNDTVYQARYDGSVRVADEATGVPFATVSSFDCDTVITMEGAGSMEELVARLDDAVEAVGRNLIYVARIDVPRCESITVRSELPQTKPYRMLAETMKTAQRKFEYRNIGGTIVAVNFPSFYAMQNTPGWHLHFISADRAKGGHVLGISIAGTIAAQLDVTPYFCLYMPETEAFARKNLDKDMSGDIQKVEK